MWVSVMISFIQFCFIGLFAHKPTELYGTQTDESILHYVMTSFLFAPWYFSSDCFMFDSLCFVAAFLIWLVLLLNFSSLLKKNQPVPQYKISMFVIIQQTLPIIFIAPLCFRISIVIELYFDTINQKLILSTILMIVVYFMFFLFTLLNAIFLEPFIFIEDTPFDVYEGKFKTLHFVLYSIDLISCFVLKTISNTVAKLVILVAMYLFFVIDIYVLLLPCPHTSIVGQFYDCVALFVLPIVVSIRLYAKVSKVYVIILFIVINLLFLLFVGMIRIYLRRKALSIFSLFSALQGKSDSDLKRGLAPHNLVGVVRTFIKYNSDPIIFEHFYALQRLYDRRASIQIEIIRFFGIFPERRRAMLDEIGITTSNSIYNQFILYSMKIRLSGLTSVSDERVRYPLEDLYKQFLDCLQGYWIARLKCKRMKAFKEALNACLIHKELKYEIKYLKFWYPFDPEIRLKYIEFLVICGGDTEAISLQKRIVRDLKTDKCLVTDPLLRQITYTNPTILQFLSRKELKTCSTYVQPYHHNSSSHTSSPSSTQNSTTNSVSSTSSPSKANVTPIFVQSNLQRQPTLQQKHEKKISSYLVKPLATPLYFLFIHHFLIIVFFIIYMTSVITYEKKSSQNSIRTYETTNLTTMNFFIASAGMFLPFSIVNSQIEVPEDPTFTNCSQVLWDMILDIKDFYAEMPGISDFVTFALPVNNIFFKDKLANSKDLCDIMRQYLENPGEVSLNFINSTSGALYTTSETIKEQINHTYTSVKIPIYSLLVSSLVMSMVTTFVTLIHILNKLFECRKCFFPFLASNERFEYLRNGKAEDSWELLRKDEYKYTFHSKENKSKKWMSYFICFFMLWLGVIALTLFNDIPHILKIMKRHVANLHMNKTFGQTQSSLYLQNGLCKLLLHQDVDKEMLLEYSKSISQGGSQISHLYSDMYPFSSPRLTLNELSKIMITNFDQYSLDFWQFTFIPAFFNFTRSCIIDIFGNEADNVVKYKDSYFISFASLILLCVSFLLFVFSLEIIKLQKCVSSIFLFPYKYTEEKEKSEFDFSDDDTPDDILFITSIAETNQIYSVSPNSLQLLNRKPESLINTPLHDVLTPVSEGLYVQTGKKNGKEFRCVQKQYGKIIKSVFIVESNVILSKSNTKANLRLIPRIFEQKNQVTLQNTAIAFLRIRDSQNLQALDRFYNELAMFFANFQNINIVKYDGTLISFIFGNNANVNSIIYLMKHIVEKSKDMPIYCSLIIDVESIQLFFNDSSEPFVDYDLLAYRNAETLLYKIPETHFAMSSKFIQIDDSFGDYLTQTNIVIEGREHYVDYILMPNDVFIQKTTKNCM